MQIERKVVSYESPELGKTVSHYILIAHTSKRSIVLSHANIFLHDTTRASLRTSSRYSSIISMLYRWLAKQPKYANYDPTQYHALVDNRDLKRWQVDRQVLRVGAQSLKPSSETIYEDLKIVLNFFHWLNVKGYKSNVDIELKQSTAYFNRSRLLSYIQAKARVSIDAKNVRALDRESRQSQRRTLINQSEIRTYLSCFTDPVYRALFKFALGTAMRPMDLCKYPYVGNGKNVHIMPYSEMDQDPKTFEYTVYASKGNKTRTIILQSDDLKELNEGYIKPFYEERRKKYKERFGHDCPPSILFLTSRGVPVTATKIASRGNAAKMKALGLDENFRESVNFYESRHWWPTMFLIRYFQEDLLKDAADVMWAACGDILRRQMGHEDLDTTFKHYVVMGRLVMLANKGKTTELISNANLGVSAFIKEVTGGSLVMGELSQGTAE